MTGCFGVKLNDLVEPLDEERPCLRREASRWLGGGDQPLDEQGMNVLALPSQCIHIPCNARPSPIPPFPVEGPRALRRDGTHHGDREGYRPPYARACP